MAIEPGKAKAKKAVAGRAAMGERLSPQLEDFVYYSDKAGESGFRTKEPPNIYERDSDMSQNPSRDEMNAKLEAVESRIEAKLAGIDAKLGNLASTASVWGAAFTAIISIGGLIVAIMSISGDRFADGMTAGQIANEVMQQQSEVDAIQDAKLDRILNAIEARDSERQEDPADTQE